MIKRHLLAMMLIIMTLSSCSMIKDHIKKPTLSYKQTEVKAISLTSVTLNVRMQLKNPNTFSISVKGVRYALNVHGKKVLSGHISQQSKIVAMGETEIQLPLTIHYKDFVSGIQAMLSTKTVVYDLKGDIDLGLMKLPFSTSGNVPMPNTSSLKW